MNTIEAFKELLRSEKLAPNLRAQWNFRFERDKLSSEKIQEALITHGYSICNSSMWKSQDDDLARNTCESMIHLLLTDRVESNKKKLWKNRFSNNKLSLGKVEEILTHYGYVKVQDTEWLKDEDKLDKSEIQPPKKTVIISNENDAVWIDDGIIHNLLKGDNYSDTEQKAHERQKLFEALQLDQRKPLIVDTSNLVSQTKEAQKFYAEFKRRNHFSCLAILATSRDSIYFGNFFKEILTLNVPCKVFLSYQEAKEWCKEFILNPEGSTPITKFENFYFWKEGNTCIQQFFVKEYKLRSAKKDLSAFMDFKGNQKMTLLIDFRSMEKMHKNVKMFYLENPEILNGFKGFAILCDHPINEKIAQFYIDHPAFTVPTRIFREKSEAIEWIRNF